MSSDAEDITHDLTKEQEAKIVKDYMEKKVSELNLQMENFKI